MANDMNYLEKTDSLAAGQALFFFWFWVHVVCITQLSKIILQNGFKGELHAWDQRLPQLGQFFIAGQV